MKAGTANLSYCSVFRYESNGIFVLGVGFFSDKFRLFNLPFLTKFSCYHSKAIELKFEKIFHLRSFS